MRVGITGASGFLGSALRAITDSLGHASFSLPLPRDGSLREVAWPTTWPSPDSLDLLIHGAASVRPATELDLYLNSQLPRELHAYFHEKNPAGRFIHISTINVLIDALIDPYSASKRLAETMIDLKRAIIIRP